MGVAVIYGFRELVPILAQRAQPGVKRDVKFLCHGLL
jgi:hypothetical protein